MHLFVKPAHTQPERLNKALVATQLNHDTRAVVAAARARRISAHLECTPCSQQHATSNWLGSDNVWGSHTLRAADRELESKRAASAGFGKDFWYLLFYAVFYVGFPVAVLYV